MEFLRAVAASGSSKAPLEAFLQAHPAALAFVQTPKPTPSSFAREQYFGVTAMRFTNGAGLARYGRYRVAPEAGVDLLSEADAAGQDADFLFDELSDRIAKGPIRSEYLEVLATRA